MYNPLISVIITTFRRNRETLINAIESVYKQSYSYIEIIVVDDNGDNSDFQKIVKETVSDLNGTVNINLIQHKVNSGAQVARNNGILNANGEYIAFLDDDDEWLPNKLELQLEVFANSDNGKLGLVYSWFYKFRQLDNGAFKKELKKYKPNKTSAKEILYFNFIGSTSFPLIKKECFEKVGKFDENLVAKQDYDMWIRIIEEFDIDCVHEPLCNYYDHYEERITNNIEKKIGSEIAFLNKHFHKIKKDKKALSIRYRLIGKYYYKNNDNNQAKKYFILSFKAFPFSLKLIISMLIVKLGINPSYV